MLALNILASPYFTFCAEKAGRSRTKQASGVFSTQSWSLIPHSENIFFLFNNVPGGCTPLHGLRGCVTWQGIMVFDLSALKRVYDSEVDLYIAVTLYTAISRKVVGKNVHATIPKGNMGNNQYTVPDTVAVKTSFVDFPWHAQTYVHGLSYHSFKFLWRKANSKPPTILFGIVNLSRSSCITVTLLFPKNDRCTQVWLYTVWKAMY